MRFVRSHVEGIAFHKQNKEFALKVLTKYVRTTGPEFLEGSYNLFKQDFIAAPYPIIKGLEPTYDYVAQTRPESAAVNRKSLSTRASSRSSTRAGLLRSCTNRSRVAHLIVRRHGIDTRSKLQKDNQCALSSFSSRGSCFWPRLHCWPSSSRPTILRPQLGVPLHSSRLVCHRRRKHVGRCR